MHEEERRWLDVQYNNRLRVPAFQDHLDAFARESEAARARLEAVLDLAYGPTERQAIDLFRPSGGRAAPLMAFIHGGYWQALDRKVFSYVAKPFVDRGVATAVLGYDLAPAVSVGAIVDQIRRALIFLNRHGRDLGVDASRIVVTGHSAGGHLAAMALATDWRSLGAPDDLVRGVVAISGLYDLEPIRKCYLNNVLGLDQDQARRLSPIDAPPPRRSVPVLVTVGGAESEAFLDQSERYVRHLRRSMDTVEHRIEDGLDHFEIVARFKGADHPMVERTLAMLGR